MAVHDLKGRLVRTLADGQQSGGSQDATWAGRTDGGQAAPGEVYVYRLTGAGIDQARKMIPLE